MEPDFIDLYYFSGTGNTLLVVRRMKEVFEEHGVSVALHRMERTDPEDMDLSHTVGLAFPVAVQGTHPFIWRFIEGLPDSDGTPVFMVDTLAVFSGGLVGPVRRILKKKGYRPIGAAEIRMPSNVFLRRIDREKNERKIARGLRSAERFAIRLLEGRTRWIRIPGLSDLMSRLSRSERLWSYYRRKNPIMVDHSRCDRCGLCVELCPVSNITMEEYPVHGDLCTYCLRCISFCPKEATYIPDGGYRRYRAVRVQELLGGDSQR